MRCLIDGDVLRYRIGFACEYTLYHITNNGDEETVKGKREFKNYIKALEEAGDVYTYREEEVVEPVENCLHSCKKQLSNILRRCKSKEYQVYLTGKGNFREE